MTLHYLITDIDETYAKQLMQAIHQEFDVPLDAFVITEVKGRMSLCAEYNKVRPSIPFYRIQYFITGYRAGHVDGKVYEERKFIQENRK